MKTDSFAAVVNKALQHHIKVRVKKNATPCSSTYATTLNYDSQRGSHIRLDTQIAILAAMLTTD